MSFNTITTVTATLTATSLSTSSSLAGSDRINLGVGIGVPLAMGLPLIILTWMLYSATTANRANRDKDERYADERATRGRAVAREAIHERGAFNALRQEPHNGPQLLQQHEPQGSGTPGELDTLTPTPHIPQSLDIPHSNEITVTPSAPAPTDPGSATTAVVELHN